MQKMLTQWLVWFTRYNFHSELTLQQTSKAIGVENDDTWNGADGIHKVL
jgi:hypothetical protein